MTVRAKFMLTGVQWQYNEARTLTFTPQYDPNIPEDVRFAKATPSGVFTMYCDNPTAVQQFELGKQYYFDITLAEVPENTTAG